MQFLWLVIKAYIGHLAIDSRCRVLELHDPNLDKPATYDGSTFSFRRTKKARPWSRSRDYSFRRIGGRPVRTH